ncbi:hypothetical protein A2U01_0007855 [Trifolium medium]|uniref:Reverse transcriptase Ty1/copia-type domain-containing protein n=1 Tax=Trifolium medium TaxID=97028 RepID=A0A392MI34_9FABA|nr:hypothetical protein [Trifolium medium]
MHTIKVEKGINKKEYFVSRDVVFVENEYPFSKISERSHDDVPWNGREEINAPDYVDDDVHCEQDLSNTNDRGGTNREDEESSSHTEISPSDTQEESQAEPEEEHLGRGYRMKKPSSRLQGFVTNTIQVLSPSDSSSSPSTCSGTPYPIAHYVNCDRFTLAHRAFLAAIEQEKEPISYSEAVKDHRWREAMQSEIRALENNETWRIVPLPPNKKALGSKWVYKIKRKSDGTIERFKARLVILGNHQVEGIDYTETFAPVAKMVTVRVVLAVAAARNWELHQMDVHNAFLHGDLQEEVFMKLPPGFNVSSPEMVCKLRKSLYGLKQAPRCWFSKLSQALKTYGFRQSLSDYSLFVLQKQGTQIVVLVYVDDLIVAGNDSAAIELFKGYLNACFHMKDLGKLKYFLGVEVAQSGTGISLSQRKYALDIISEVGLLGAKPALTPLEQNHHLALANGSPLRDPEKYRRLVGRLIYLCFTRPELSYCVHTLSQFMQQQSKTIGMPLCGWFDI